MRASEFRGGEVEDRRSAALTDVCSLYHAHVVPTIANTTHPFLGVVTNETRHVCFLRGRTAARDDSGQLRGYFDKFILVQIQTELLR